MHRGRQGKQAQRGTAGKGGHGSPTEGSRVRVSMEPPRLRVLLGNQGRPGLPAGSFSLFSSG